MLSIFDERSYKMGWKRKLLDDHKTEDFVSYGDWARNEPFEVLILAPAVLALVALIVYGIVSICVAILALFKWLI